MRRYDLMVAAAEGYSNEATRKLLALAQAEHGYQILVWHDADPYGYNIARTLAEPTEGMPDHHLDVIDMGLRLEEGLEMGLQTETFTHKKALPEDILPMLTDKELELFTGEQWQIQRDPDRFEWRNSRRPARLRAKWWNWPRRWSSAVSGTAPAPPSRNASSCKRLKPPR